MIKALDEVSQTGRSRVGQGTPIIVEREPGQPEKRFVDFVLQPIFDVAGNVSSIFMQGSDVTHEKRSIDALRTTQAGLEAALEANQAIFDTSLDVICTVNGEGRFTQVSQHAADIWGFAAEELIGTPFMDRVHPDDLDSTLEMYAQIIGGTPTVAFHNRYIHKDGTPVPVMWSAAWSPRHNTMVAIARDMRESLAKEQQLRRAQKMEAIGRLTGGVAHDFNNLLTIIIGGAEALLDMLEPGGDAHDIAKLALGAGERGAELVSQLLTFSRAKTLDPLPVDIAGLFSALEPLVRRTIGEHIEVRFQAEPGLACVADRAQLDSALLNLAINARDAMPRSGQLTIQAKAVDLAARDVANLKPGSYVRFSVTDTGHGMDAKTIERAMEPFFTTKEVGKGTGLGLAMVYGFATQSGGSLRIRSTPGQGTVVDMALPRTSLAPTASAEQPAPEETGEAKILVVEDDAMVRAHIVRLLRSMGYAVTESENGARALEILQARENVDLMLTDVVMPGGMSGFQLADRARLSRPGLKVLFTSGYADDQIVETGQAYADAELLRKPYRRAELANRVASMLAS